LPAGAIPVMLGASAVGSAFATAGREAPFLITMGCTGAALAGALLAATTDAEGLDESMLGLTLLW